MAVAGTAASRYVASAEEETEVSFLAANPELMAHSRYTGSVDKGTDIPLLAANPELMVHSRYTGSVEEGPEVSRSREGNRRCS